MADVPEDWWVQIFVQSQGGSKLIETVTDFNAACEHVVHLLEDSSTLLEAGSHATAAFVAITAIEETAKAHIGIYAETPAKRRQDPLFSHSKKHLWGLLPTVSMGERLQLAIGDDRMRELISQGHAGGFVKIREAAIYFSQGLNGLIVPREAVTPEISRELLLLAIEAFYDAAVGYSKRSTELGDVADKLFEKWAERRT